MNYLIGVDFGTLSCRAALVTADGQLVKTAAMDYAHGCIDAPNGGVLQEPRDYLDCLQYTVRQVAAGYEDSIVSLGIDFTACTCLPVDSNLQPLGQAKLWKSHSAQPQADRIADLCRELNIDLTPYGGVVSPQWLIPKLLELKECQPEVYAKTAHYLEAADWLVWLLTDSKVRSACFARFKGQYREDWPKELLRRLELDESKLAGEVKSAGDYAGLLSAYGAEFLGLTPYTAVVASVIDAHAALPAAGICAEGDMMLILGTSGCNLMLSKHEAPVPGVYGRIMDGILPGYFVYESGTPALGDMFGWFMDNCVPKRYYDAAGGDLFGYLEALAAKVTDNPVWCIDWWNGSRSPYLDASLTGSLFGLSLRTRPEHIYRALLEAAAFNTRQIFENLERNGVAIRRIVAGGGIPKKNALYMQLLADVLQRPIHITDNEPACAIGAAILAAWGGGLYGSPEEAVAAMSKAPGSTVLPDPEANYDARYRRYCETADRLAAR